MSANRRLFYFGRQAYVLFKSPQAATATKQKVESFGEGQQYTKKFTVSYTSPYTNPFRTLPKDGPMRNSNPPNNNRSTPGGFGGAAGMSNLSSQQAGFNMNNASSGYRGGRGGGYNSRGGGMNSMPNYNRGGFQQPMAGGFQGAQMGGFQGTPMGAMQSYGGYPNRGGMMGGMRGGAMNMRGGRGGISSNGMMGMPMGNMAMGGMGAQMGGMGMGMPQMGAAMGMQGMRASHTYPSISTAGPYSSSANTARLVHASNQSIGHYTSPVIATGQYSSCGSPSGYPPSIGGVLETLRLFSPPSGHLLPNVHACSQALSLHVFLLSQ